MMCSSNTAQTALDDNPVGFHTMQALRRKIPAKLIKQRPGAFNRMLDYVEPGLVINRLDEAFGGSWTFEITETREYPYSREKKKDGKMITVTGTEFVVLGKLSITNRLSFDPVVKMQYGSCESGDGMSPGDALKGAASDAMKKCATLLGIGLELQGDDEVYRELDQPPVETRCFWLHLMSLTGQDQATIKTDFDTWAQKLVSFREASPALLLEFARARYGVVVPENPEQETSTADTSR